jgi:epoxyqueuosine reductase QueG
VICVGKLYNQPVPPEEEGRAVISRYAWGQDYHHVIREGLEKMAARLLEIEPFEWKICVDTAPLLERSYARQAGLGWIGRNTSLINEPLGSWFFLAEPIPTHPRRTAAARACAASKPVRRRRSCRPVKAGPSTRAAASRI